MRSLNVILAVSILPFACVSPAIAADPQVTPVQEFRDCPDCPDMVKLKAGRFTIGATLSEEERFGVPKNLQGCSLPLQWIKRVL